jgi:hypothetical protein
MSPENFLNEILEPSIARLVPLLPGVNFDAKAKVMLMAIAGQESYWSERRQVGIGQYHPQSVGARGWWQFESTWGGPVAMNDVLQSASKQIGAVCTALVIPTDERTVYEACAWNDVLSTALARLLLWLDPAPLPDLGQRDTAWDYYQRNWKPGAPHPEVWPNRYGTALALVK